jgi:hypothetical protein
MPQMLVTIGTLGEIKSKNIRKNKRIKYMVKSYLIKNIKINKNMKLKTNRLILRNWQKNDILNYMEAETPV